MLVKKTGPLQQLRDHKCWKCGYTYSYDINKPNNSYVDYDDSSYYNCPKCGKSYYPIFQDINVLGNLIRNIF